MKRLSLLVMCILCISSLTGCGAVAMGTSAYAHTKVDALVKSLILAISSDVTH
jgi:hypothetical protein